MAGYSRRKPGKKHSSTQAVLVKPIKITSSSQNQKKQSNPFKRILEKTQKMKTKTNALYPKAPCKPQKRPRSSEKDLLQPFRFVFVCPTISAAHDVFSNTKMTLTPKNSHGSLKKPQKTWANSPAGFFLRDILEASKRGCVIETPKNLQKHTVVNPGAWHKGKQAPKKNIKTWMSNQR